MRARAFEQCARRPAGRANIRTWCLVNGGIALIGFAIFLASSGRLGSERNTFHHAIWHDTVFRCYAGRLNARGKETVRHSSVSAVSDHPLSASSSHQEPFKIAIIGAGFAGVAAAWHVMNVISEDGDADSRVINSRPVQLHSL